MFCGRHHKKPTKTQLKIRYETASKRLKTKGHVLKVTRVGNAENNWNWKDDDPLFQIL